ncbi:uncharacterized protein LOC116175898 [Photinus pyralis]|uniref:uncharacterized protein LOC116175898 n=2 Tax=Photinus pyralis TaxID=7054 RepID=UPI001266E953|nr:uncharacterized protein LOC116175898 [Photinus pyralis]
MELRSGFKKADRAIQKNKMEGTQASEDIVFSQESQEILEAAPVAHIQNMDLSILMKAIQGMQQEMKTGQEEMKAGQAHLENKMEAGQEQIIKTQEKNIEQLRNEIRGQKQECERRFTIHEKKIEGLHQQHVGFTQQVDYEFKKVEHQIAKQEKITDQKITDLDNKVERNTEEIEEIKEKIKEEKPINTQKASTIIYKTEGLTTLKPKKFDGSFRSVHPVNFLKSLENYWMNMHLKEQKMNIMEDYLEGCAKAWTDLHQSEWRNFKEFKREFLEQFWSTEKQNKIRHQLNTPRLYNARNGSYTDHVWYWVSKTAHLEPRIKEDQLIEALVDHFPRDIQMVLYAAQAKTIKNLTEILEKIQETNRDWRRDSNRPETRDQDQRPYQNRNRENQDRRENRQQYERRDQDQRNYQNRNNYQQDNRREANPVNYGRGRGNYGAYSRSYDDRRQHEGAVDNQPRRNDQGN